jgi:hypothetical protein
MGERAGRSFPSVGILRFTARYEGGSLIELEDHSRWEISPGHEIYTLHWVPQARITVVPGEIPDYPYDLINAESGDRVPARHKGIPSRWTLRDDSRSSEA